MEVKAYLFPTHRKWPGVDGGDIERLQCTGAPQGPAGFHDFSRSGGSFSAEHSLG